jgi:hypothetical protein
MIEYGFLSFISFFAGKAPGLRPAGQKRETVKRDEWRDDRHIIREQTKPVE